MEKMAPLPVPTHSRPEMTVREEICSGERDKKAGPGEERQRDQQSGAYPFKQSGFRFWVEEVRIEAKLKKMY